MSIWDKTVTKIDGTLFAYVRIQNDFTGTISGQFKRVFYDKDGMHYYCRADGRRVDVTNEVHAELARIDLNETAIEFYNKYRRMHYQ